MQINDQLIQLVSILANNHSVLFVAAYYATLKSIVQIRKAESKVSASNKNGTNRRKKDK
ncbi:MAG TPA: hypothetical protein PKD17_04560 [Cellvibrionaceae bacterium]|nr:hypothetical protein [Cellvibrionaceae bacterium]HMW71065.1 hypothetical protein [Cellvibrionaceae bacterium]HMY38652.1 hypothetical protein [Marinagarivorans sp.]